MVVEIQPRDSVTATGLRRFLLDAQDGAAGIKLHHPIALGVADGIGKNGAAIHTGSGGLELGNQLVTMEEVVAQHQGRRRAGKKVGADQEGLCEAIGAGLHGIGDRHPPGAAITEQPLEGGLVVRGGDDQHLTDPGQHQGAERVMDHWLVVHRHQLLAHRRGKRCQASATASSENDALARHCRPAANS